jgi:hypothetical protein
MRATVVKQIELQKVHFVLSIPDYLKQHPRHRQFVRFSSKSRVGCYFSRQILHGFRSFDTAKIAAHPHALQSCVLSI